MHVACLCSRSESPCKDVSCGCRLRGIKTSACSRLPLRSGSCVSCWRLTLPLPFPLRYPLCVLACFCPFPPCSLLLALASLALSHRRLLAPSPPRPSKEDQSRRSPRRRSIRSLPCRISSSSQTTLSQPRVNPSTSALHPTHKSKSNKATLRSSPLPLNTNNKELRNCSNCRRGCRTRSQASASQASQAFQAFQAFQVVQVVQMVQVPTRVNR